MTDIDTTNNPTTQPVRRRRIDPAERAVERQLAMAREDSDARYAFGVSVHPIEFIQPALKRCCDTRQQLQPALKRSVQTKIDRKINSIQRVVAESEIAIQRIRYRFLEDLRKRRLQAFRSDFKARQRFAGRTAPGECLLCSEQKDEVVATQCCGTAENPNRVCVGCSEQNAFFSSKYGTVRSATCPFCRAQFDYKHVSGSSKRKREE